MNKEKKSLEVNALDLAALKKALTVRSSVRAGLLSVITHNPVVGGPPFCLGCGRGL